jgi:FAD/FMN-containing dehydrogenase
MKPEILEQLRSVFNGDMYTDPVVLKEYSRDASVCEIIPQVVLCPKTIEDVKSIVKFVSSNPGLSITVRAAGTDMSGAAIGESIILDVNKYIQGIVSWGTIGKNEAEITVLPGTFYRDFEKETMSKGFFLPSYPASKLINTVGGMVGNNSAGEKTLTYGQTEKYVKSLKVILRDGNEYFVKPLNKIELDKKLAQNDLEGELYKSVWKIVSENADEIKSAKPITSKNSAGFAMWNIWNDENFKESDDFFDLTKAIVGSQGTLGIVSEITFKLVPVHLKSQMLVVFMPSLDPIGPLVKDILTFSPTSLESYDEETIKLAVKYFRDLPHQAKWWSFLKLAWDFMPEFQMVRSGGIPKLVLLIEFTGDTDDEIAEKIKKLDALIKDKYYLKTEYVTSPSKAKKFWTIRRESYNLLRKHAEGKKIATFIEDVIVPPEHLPEFIPQYREILHSYNLTYSIAGHAGSGNFHVFPLMDFKNPEHIENIIEISKKVYNLVTQYKGSITAEHSDGIVRAPFLSKMFTPKTLELFVELKKSFDPQNIFNPGKKVGATVEYFKNHIIKE